MTLSNRTIIEAVGHCSSPPISQFLNPYLACSRGGNLPNLGTWAEDAWAFPKGQSLESIFSKHLGTRYAFENSKLQTRKKPSKSGCWYHDHPMRGYRDRGISVTQSRQPNQQSSGTLKLQEISLDASEHRALHRPQVGNRRKHPSDTLRSCPSSPPVKEPTQWSQPC